MNCRYVPPYPIGGTDGEPEPRRPKCKLVGADGNVFSLIGKAAKALKDAGRRQKAQEMNERCFASHSYDEALTIIQEYVDVH